MTERWMVELLRLVSLLVGKRPLGSNIVRIYIFELNSIRILVFSTTAKNYVALIMDHKDTAVIDLQPPSNVTVPDVWITSTSLGPVIQPTPYVKGTSDRNYIYIVHVIIDKLH